jgi:3-oxoacyl-[acyl-carrier-protein] synthase II
MRRRVVITGMGAVTPLGNTIESTWQNLLKGVSGIGKITKFDADTLPVRIAGELKDFAPYLFIPRKDINRLDPFIHYATASAMMAVEDAGLAQRAEVRKCGSAEVLKDPSELPSFRASELNSAGVIIGSSRGGITSIERSMSDFLLNGRPFSAYLMSASTISMASSYIAMRLGIRGQALGISTACASGANTVGEAIRLIRDGEVDIALAGGAEAPICRVAIGGYGSAGALSRRNGEPQKASRPFDRQRDGFVIAEGACVLVLEELGHALRRGARIYAEVSGYGKSSDALHQTRPDINGEAVAIEIALRDAGASVDEVGYINTHATSTLYGDMTEAEAIRRVFGKRADDIPVSACKSMLGHMLGASGALEAAITALTIYKGMIPPTINLDEPECDLNHVTSTMNKDIDVAISNSFGFGGINAVLVLRRFKG